MGKREDRLNKAISHLKANNAMSIVDLACLLKVSSMTVRRDLEILEKKNIVKVLHGGAVYNVNGLSSDADQPDYHLQKEKVLQKAEKARIATAATSLIKAEETVMLDTGTTIYYLAKKIPQDMPLTAICWSLNVLEELIKKTQCSLISVGGIFHSETQMFESKEGMEIIRNKRAAKAFISAGGLHKELGITCPFYYEIATKQEAIRSSLTNILLLDSTKFGKVRSSYLASIDAFDIIITDSNIPEDYKKYIQEAGIQLIIV